MTKLREGYEIDRAAVRRYVRRLFGEDDAELLELRELAASTQESLKDYGYGKPLLARVARAGGSETNVVIRTMSPDPFGHDRRADRVGALVLDYDTFGQMPRHIQPLDIGLFDDDGEMRSIASGEPFLVTTYVEGELYAHDLKALQGADRADARDVERAEALADYLAALHATTEDGTRGLRAMRDTVGSGEGIFGLCDSYPRGHAIASAERLEGIERACVSWRWKLRDRVERRARRTHGDFHPFNILFRDGSDFTVLDCSRGGAGEPADDVTCLSINYLFFALAGGAERFEGALRTLWDTFFARYLARSGDAEVLEMVAPFFAWRGLVVASPVWYPNVSDTVRERLLCFIERLLAGEAFDPARVDELLR
ncbi:MAG: phosphotransferase [Myxococcales bacterium]|nr:phosphotransferase [Myxococcales bacterium]